STRWIVYRNALQLPPPSLHREQGPSRAGCGAPARFYTRGYRAHRAQAEAGRFPVGIRTSALLLLRSSGDYRQFGDYRQSADSLALLCGELSCTWLLLWKFVEFKNSVKSYWLRVCLLHRWPVQRA